MTDGSRRSVAAFIATGGVLTGALGLATALVLQSLLKTDSGVGPTAATLNDAFSLLLGAQIGLGVGTACVAFSAPSNRRILTAVVAGLVGYAIVLTPALIVTGPNDVSVAESIGTAAFAAILVAPPILLGAAVGAAVAGRRNAGAARWFD
jgi:hypothetical protein